MMKTKLIIIIAICMYAAAMVYSYQYVDTFIDQKVAMSEIEIEQSIRDIFKSGHKRIYDISFSPNGVVEYDKVAIPKKPVFKPIWSDTSSIYEFEKKQFDEKLADWKNDYGNIYKLYALKRKNWELVSLELGGHYEYWRDEGLPVVCVSYIYPYAVGYFKDEFSYYYSYEPSVESALEYAFDFWTTNEKSNYINSNSWYESDFKRGNYDKTIDEIFSCSNDYYYIKKDEKPAYHIGGDKPFDNWTTTSVKNTYMYNGYYRVYDCVTQPITYSIYKYDDKIIKDKESLRIKWAVWLTIILLAIIIPLIVMEKKKQKLQSETIYDKLKRLCNPSNFMKNYDKEKVDAANEIYQRLLQTSPDDKEQMDEIQQQAVKRLKISLIEPSLLNELRKKVNPQNFMKNYDAEKVFLANDLYARLSKDNLTYNEFIEIQELSKQL
ncbi:MAG: hypothetical protein IKR66_04670 [Bacteroidales bacterium]|nr:hypothetical protein [Bacteroidales bacterium]